MTLLFFSSASIAQERIPMILLTLFVRCSVLGLAVLDPDFVLEADLEGLPALGLHGAADLRAV